MPDRPLVSIVTPTLDQGQFIEHTLRSVRAQTYPNVEHVVVDGGSTDATLPLLRAAGDAGQIRWISEPDGGLYDAVNKGVGLTTGEIVAYLNSDDALLPWAVETAVAAFDTHPELDLVFGDGVKVDDDTGEQRLRLFPPFDRVRLAHYESLMQPAVFVRRRLLDRIGGFDAGMRYVADLDAWLRASAAGARIAHVDEVLAVERIHAARLSSARASVMAEENRAMRARHTGTPDPAPGRARAVRAHRAWLRWKWLRFLVAATFRPKRGPWSRFLREGGVTVNSRRIVSGQLPGRSSRLQKAVRSRMAADVLGVRPGTARQPA